MYTKVDGLTGGTMSWLLLADRMENVEIIFH